MKAPSWRGRRILCVSSSYPFHRDDFRARFVHELARTFVDAGAAVQMLTPRTPEARCHREDVEGVQVYRFDYPLSKKYPLVGGNGIIPNLRKRPAAAAAIPGLLAGFARETHEAAKAVDLVVCHWLVPAGLIAAHAAARVPKLFVAHSSDVHLLASMGFAGRRMAQQIGQRGPIVATSAFLAAKLRTMGVAAHTVPLGIESPKRTRVRQRANALCTMGRLVPGKGLDRLLDVVARSPRSTVTIAGAGPERDRLAARCRSPELRGRARIIGPVLGPAKRAFFEEHDFFVFAPTPKGSWCDSQPVSAVEAMAHGLPLATTEVGGLPELVATGGGCIVPADATKIARALEALEPPEIQAMSVAAQEFGAERGWTNYLARVSTILRHASGAGSPP